MHLMERNGNGFLILWIFKIGERSSICNQEVFNFIHLQKIDNLRIYEPQNTKEQNLADESLIVIRN